VLRRGYEQSRRPPCLRLPSPRCGRRSHRWETQWLASTRAASDVDARVAAVQGDPASAVGEWAPLATRLGVDVGHPLLARKLGRTRHVATSPPGRSLPWKHRGKAPDDVMKLRAIQKTSKALLETMEQRQTEAREALEGQGHGKH